MSVKSLLNPALFSASLSANATTNTVTVSTSDAIIIDNIRQAYGGIVRALVCKPAILTQPGAVFETVVVSGINTGTGVITVPSTITNSSIFTVASGTQLLFNLISDGWMEQFGIDGNWTLMDSLEYGIKSMDSKGGVQSFLLEGAGVGDYAKQIFKTDINEDYYFTAYGLETTDPCRIVISGNLASSTEVSSAALDFALDSSSWKRYDGCFTVSGTGNTELRLYANADGAKGNFDNISCVRNLIVNGGFDKANIDTDFSAVNSTIATNSANRRFCAFCGNVTATSNNGYIRTNNITVVDGQWYTFSGYGKSSAAGHQFKFQIIGNQTNTTYYDSGWVDSITYKNKSVTFRVITDTSIHIRGVVETSGEIVYFDDWSLIPLISISPSSETPTSLINSYAIDKWSTNATGSVLIDGGDLYCVPITSGLDLNPDKGSVQLWYRPNFDYNDLLEDAVLVSGTSFLRVRYNYSDYKFYGEIWNGNEFVSSGCNSLAQTFTSGTWINVGFSYNNTIGTNIYINGTTEGDFEGTWTQQTLPTLMSIGCVSGTYSNRANGYIDDLNFYIKNIGAGDFRIKYGENHTND